MPRQLDPRIPAAGALLLCPLLYAAGPIAGRLAILATGLFAIIAMALPDRRVVFARLALATALAATGALALHLLLDDFSLRHVWLYSAPALPWYLKLANLWGGDESTLLFLAMLTAILTPSLCRREGWAGPGALLLLILFAAAASLWSPFAATPPEDAARLPARA